MSDRRKPCVYNVQVLGCIIDGKRAEIQPNHRAPASDQHLLAGVSISTLDGCAWEVRPWEVEMTASDLFLYRLFCEFALIGLFASGFVVGDVDAARCFVRK